MENTSVAVLVSRRKKKKNRNEIFSPEIIFTKSKRNLANKDLIENAKSSKEKNLTNLLVIVVTGYKKKASKNIGILHPEVTPHQAIFVPASQ